MSRSFRKTPIFPVASDNGVSWWKRYRAHRERMLVRNAIHHGDYELAETQMARWDEWSCPRDGKYYSKNFYPRAGFGIHRDYSWRRWAGLGWNTREYWDKEYKKALRK